MAASVTTLRDDVHYYVHQDGRYDYTQTTVTRIDDADLTQRNHTEQVWFDAARENISIREACLVHPNGQRRCVPPSRIRLQPAALRFNGAEYGQVRALRIPFAQLAAGDEIRLVTHTTMFRKPAIAGQFLAYLEPAGRTGPGATSLTIDLPAALPLQTVSPGFTAAPPQRQHGRVLYRWRRNSEPNARAEAGAVDGAARRPHVLASTYADYAAIAHIFAGLFERKTVPDTRLTTLATALTAHTTNRREQVLAIYHWVQENIRYQAIYGVDGGAIPPWSAAQILRRGNGDCKDHVILMTALLRAAGIASTPALVYTSPDKFTLPEVPAALFDHVITYVPSLDLYLDATFKDAAGPYLPKRLLDKPTLLAATGQVGHTPVHQDGKETRHLAIGLQPDGAATFTYDVETDGVRAALLRRKVEGAPDAENGAWLASLLRKRGWNGSGTERFDGTQADRYTYRMQGRIEAFLPMSGAQHVHLQTALHREMNDIATQLDAEPARTQPFLCDQADLQETAIYTLPPAVGLADIPSDVDVQAGVLRYAARYRYTGQTLSVTRHVQRRKNASRICTPEDFSTMRPAIDAMREDLQHQLRLLPLTVARPGPTPG